MRICVDPGHSKQVNHSPIRPDFAEGDRMWVLGLMLRDALQRRGVEVVMTKDSLDANPNLAERGAKANGCDAFISLHANSPAHRPDGTYDETISGVVVFYPIKQPEVVPLAEVIADRVADVMHTKVFDVTCKESEASPGLDYYGVLRASVRAGCPYDLIVEHGFYTNKENVDFLMDDDNLAKIAEVEAKTLVDWCRVHEQYVYRVQCGAYSERKNAFDKVERLKQDGFDAFMEHTDLWRVYAGSFYIEANAVKEVEKLKEKGYEAFIVPKVMR